MAVCPSCGEPVSTDARFCEACGAELSATASAVATAAASPASTGVCVSCGAAASEIAVDGYCGHCGMKQPAPGDHREIDLGAVAAVGDRGLHHHRNEDAFAISQVDLPGSVVRIIVVCDGVSSTAEAHLAAQAAADAACATLSAGASTGSACFAELTIDAIAAAQGAASAIPPRDGVTPSCTIVTAIASIRRLPAQTAARAEAAEASVTIGWLGDSRAYWMSDSDLRQLSIDDSWSSEQIAAGMSEDAAYNDRRAHVITRWLGADATDLVPRVETLHLARPSKLLLCSDGLWNYAPTTHALAARIAEQGAPASNLQLARALTNFARDAGGHDNITVAIADL
ncbi:MAG TPA: zinc ribbon domain-containing protein [Acidimicrobiales bacterium]|nr:zinc ribbon domain-containing protein [Acidimicrobiales bacterium]